MKWKLATLLIVAFLVWACLGMPTGPVTGPCGGGGAGVPGHPYIPDSVTQ